MTVTTDDSSFCAEETAHDLSEFHSFPWDILSDALNWRETESVKQVGGISRGGVTGGLDFNPRRPHIDFLSQVDGVLIVDAWEIPESLVVFVEEHEKRAREQLQGELRTLIGASRAP